MNFKRLLYTDLGRMFLSIILGLGLATLFRKVCTEKNCLSFNGPIISDLEGKIYKHGNKCYKYSSNTDKCDSTKRQVDLKSKDTDNDT
jgi:hypothetical protein|tara:strand:+ start:228 stop:491 length:264 start_codon:yes stop_codon:yes gene_type:complete